MVRRKVCTPLLLREHLKIAAERHVFFVVMKEVRDFWRGGPVRAQKFLLLVLSRQSECQICLHVNGRASEATIGRLLLDYAGFQRPNDFCNRITFSFLDCLPDILRSLARKLRDITGTFTANKECVRLAASERRKSMLIPSVSRFIFAAPKNSDIIRTYAKKPKQVRGLCEHTLLSIMRSFRVRGLLPFCTC